MQRTVQYRLRQRPESAADVVSCLERTERRLPEPDVGQVLLETLWLSAEPYMMLAMTGALSEQRRPAATRMLALQGLYAAGAGLGAVMVGPAICRVLQSRHSEFVEGDIVSSYSGWQTHAIDDGTVLKRIDDRLAPLQAYLGPLGIPGLTGYSGMKEVGLPKNGETVVVSAAMGAVGAVAGAVARAAGARTIGITGTEAKRLHMRSELGFDEAVDRKAADFTDQLRSACPKGIDVYFENVGGMVWRAVLPMFRPFARIPVSGTVADYAPQTREPERDRVPELMKRAVPLRLTIQGFAVFDYARLEDECIEVISDQIRTKSFRYVEDRYDGIDAAPGALADIVAGRTTGKVVIEITD